MNLPRIPRASPAIPKISRFLNNPTRMILNFHAPPKDPHAFPDIPRILRVPRRILYIDEPLHQESLNIPIILSFLNDPTSLMLDFDKPFKDPRTSPGISRILKNPRISKPSKDP